MIMSLLKEYYFCCFCFKDSFRMKSVDGIMLY